VAAVGDEAGSLVENIRTCAEWLKQDGRIGDESCQPGFRPGLAAQRDQRTLATGRILAGRLAHRLGVCCQVKQVVGQLEGKADRLAIGAHQPPLFSAASCNDGACLAGKADQRAGLHRLQRDDCRLVRCRCFCCQIQRLPPGHAADTGSARKGQNQFGFLPVGKIGFRGGDDIERQSQKAVAGKDRIGLAMGDMHGRLTAAEIVIVHGGQVVMDKRIAVNAFECCADTQGRLPVAMKKCRAFYYQEWAQPLASVQQSMAHCSDERCGPGDLVCLWFFVENADQAGLDLCGAGLQADFKGCLAHAALFGMTARPLATGFYHICNRMRGLLCVTEKTVQFYPPLFYENWMDHQAGVSGVDIVPETRGEEEDVPSSRSRGWGQALRRRWRQILLIAVAIVLLPYVLIILYAPSFIHPISTLMLRDLVLLRGYDRQWVSFEDISPNLVQSVMMSEDGQFCLHDGVDWRQMRGVVNDALEGESTRGASTIPMQTAKNLFLWNGRSFIRKGMELPLALASDFVWSKQRMMELYLNVAEWGPGIYGAEAAAKHHFGVSAAKLTKRQAALLAVSLPNPYERNAGKPGRGLRSLASLIERRASRSGEYIKCLYE
jgi:monofunctional biosynthetic peptidoglycan transglycosylase